MCAAAALATIDLIEDGLMENAARMGRRLTDGLRAIAAENPRIRDVRGIGLMVGVEFGSGTESDAVQQAAFRRGLLLLECGESSLRFSPPLIVDEAAVDRAVELFGDAVNDTSAQFSGIRETGG